MSFGFIEPGMGNVKWNTGVFISTGKELTIRLIDDEFFNGAIMSVYDGNDELKGVLIPSAAVLRKIGEVAAAMADQLDKQKAYKRLIKMEECS